MSLFKQFIVKSYKEKKTEKSMNHLLIKFLKKKKRKNQAPKKKSL